MQLSSFLLLYINFGAPLEQFEFSGFISFLFIIGGIFLFILVDLCNISFFSFLLFGKYSIVVVNMLFSLIFQLNKNNIQGNNQQYFLLFSFLFIVILISNLLGLLPYNGTLTASVFFTVSITTCLFIGFSWIAVLISGVYSFYFFYPESTPKFLLKFLILIEIISYFVRAISLPVRLIANLVSGHALLKILVGFMFMLYSMNSFFKILFIFPWFLILIILTLETMIGFLQAYVFIFLLTIYLNQAFFCSVH